MSYDVDIITTTPPTHRDVLGWATDRPELSVEGNLESGHTIIVAENNEGHQPLFAVEAPVQVDFEELPAEVARPVHHTPWVTGISIPERRIEMARSAANGLAIYLAQKYVGSVYDPQLDAMVWPSKLRVSGRRSDRLEPFPIVTLTWIYPIHELGEQLPTRVLESMDAIMPQCRPGARAEQKLLAFCLQQRSNPLPIVEAWNWRARDPVFDGEVRINARWNGRIKGAAPAVAFDLHIDGLRVIADPVVRDAVVRLFEVVAVEPMALFAGAYLSGSFTFERGELFGPSEVNQPNVGVWHGIPSHEPWLAWFGPAYYKHLEQLLDLDECRAVSGGIMCRTSDVPLANRGPGRVITHIPQDVLGHVREIREVFKGPAGRATVLEDVVIEPAPVLPGIEREEGTQ